MPRTSVTLDHLASRWDRSPDSLRADIDRSADQGADIITLTEVADGKRPAALRREGWTVCQDRHPWQAGESAVMVRDSFGEVLEWETTRIGPDLGPGNAVFGIVAVVRIHATGETVLVAESHLPSSVERKWRGRRGRAYREMVRRYRRSIRRLRRKYRPDAVCIWADWNLNLNLAWVRDWAKRVWVRAKTLGKRKTPRRGTHGPRLIDWPVTRRLRKRRLTVLGQTKGSDHRGVRLRAVIRKRRRA